MSINWVMLSDTEKFVRLPGERILYTSPPRTTLSLQSQNKFPGKEPVSIQSAGGVAYLTNQRIVYLPTAPTPDLQSFAAPILNLHDSHVSAPFFGPNVWTALLQPVPGGGIPPSSSALELKMVFKEGGAFDFHSNFERLKERLHQAVDVARESGHIPPTGGSVNGVNLSNIDLEQLPAYEEHARSPPVDVPAAATTFPSADSGLGASPEEETSAKPSPPPSSEQQRYDPPAEPPPGYEEVQRSSVADELERRLRGPES